MAALDSHEQEQLEALKAWWYENRGQILVMLLIAFAAIGGWRGWQYYHKTQANDAAVLYQQLINQTESSDGKRVNDAASVLMEAYPSTAYAPRAALLAAQTNEKNKDAARAKAQLQWAIDHTEDDALKSVARLRLASMLLDEKNHDGALKLLEAPHPPSFDGLFADLRGDILSAQGKTEEAKSAYKLAYEKIDNKSTFRNLIQIKLDALGAAK